jgi:hypothetical protein
MEAILQHGAFRSQLRIKDYPTLGHVRELSFAYKLDLSALGGYN